MSTAQSDSPASLPRPAPLANVGRKRAIVLSGGGARGAYEAGVLQFILDELPRRHQITPRFEILCGTSVGAIHACFLAATADEDGEHAVPERGQRLVEIWERLHVDEVFRFGATNVFTLPRRILGVRRVAEQLAQGQRPDRLFGLLDTGPLEQLVLQSIPWRGIRRNLKSGRIESVCVAATQIATGRAVVFCEQATRELPPWASQANIRMQPIRLSPIHALASAAIPLLFPAVRVGARYYADGGLRLNTPLAPAVRLGADRVLVIGLAQGGGAEDVSETLAQERTSGFGNPMFLFGKILNALMLSPIDADIARLHLINEIINTGEKAFGGDFLHRLNAAGGHPETGDSTFFRPLKRIHDLVIRPSKDLGMIAGSVMSDGETEIELNTVLRLFRKVFGSGQSPRESDLLSYLLFEQTYTRALAELGYKDAEAQEMELVQFFLD